jgi:DWNN domain
MSSTILYKFRSGTTYEALTLPGNNTRLLDIKKAIVIAKKLDHGSMDFDLSVKDGTSGMDYVDDTAIVPRGTRIVVQRLPSARGQGILAKLARNQQFGTAVPTLLDAAARGTTTTGGTGLNSDFYTIDSRNHDEDEEFVSSSIIIPSLPLPPPPPPSTEDSELAALRAATEASSTTTSDIANRTSGIGLNSAMLRGGPGGGGAFRMAGMGPPPPSRGLEHYPHVKPTKHHRPHADPEIREQEQQQQTQKKRATGIPRTFLSLSAPTTGADGAESASLTVIQPNTFVFDELVNRGGGQSENATGTKRDLEYALKITATTIPEYLQCAICHAVVRDAMMLPWDPEGRTTCEQCIRTALTENGFRCPLTQQEGVSPDDLFPNHALRKAAVQFVKDVMEKMKEIHQQTEMEEDEINNVENDKQNLLDGDLNDKGVILSRRANAAEKRKKMESDDYGGGGDDDFGGDVFAVEAHRPDDDERMDHMITETEEDRDKNTIDPMEEESNAPKTDTMHTQFGTEPIQSKVDVTMSEEMEVTAPVFQNESVEDKNAIPPTTEVPVQQVPDVPDRRVPNRRRGPPVGYTMGPAVAVAVSSPSDSADVHRGEYNNTYSRGSYRGRRGGRSPYNSEYKYQPRGFRGRYDPNIGGRYVTHTNTSPSSNVRFYSRLYILSLLQ